MSNKKLLSSTYPELLPLWHPVKNGGLTPEQVSASSSIAVWWLCPEGHSWETTVRNCVIGKGRCPYCSGYKVLSGFNDFATTHPSEASRWHPTKNGDLSPSKLSSGSNKKAWWRCKEGHEWEARVSSVTAGTGSGCAVCLGHKILTGFNDLATVAPEAASRWHPTKNGNLSPSKLSSGSNKKAWWKCEEGHEWEAVISSVARQRTGCPYCTGKRILKGFNDLTSVHPEIAMLWHPTKNSALSPTMVGRGSRKKVWWKCAEGHEWEAVISNVVSQKSGCIYCSGKDLIQGYNDLTITHPLIAKKWHPTKNFPMTPNQVKHGSTKKVWWLCSEKHEWESTVVTQTNTSCPYCYGRYVLSGENDLATLYPAAAKEWHPTKNGQLTPDKVMPFTPKKAWWLCSEGHEWRASPNSRFTKSAYTRCPYCSGKKILKGFNDLATTHPKIAAEWHFIKNGRLLPSQISKGYDPYVWWQCNKGHEWEIPPYARTGKDGTNCPVCSHKRVDVGVTDLKTLNPVLAEQWHPTKNGDLTPDKVAAYSSVKVWWQCSKNHEWEAAVSNRHQGRNCAKCTSGEKASKAENALALYVESLGLDIVRHGRDILKGQELDIYVPMKKIAIEYNGIYWHTEIHGNKGQNYHHDKWLECKKLGIQLIQIWEDDWNRNPQQIKRMLAHKLGCSAERKVFARKTMVAELTKQEAESFLDDNHIQGFASGSYYLGLKEKSSGELVCVLILKKEAGTKGRTLNIIRYATSANVVGGFTKLLSYSDKMFKPEAYLTFADHCVSDGGLYESNGFVADKVLPPDYMYFFNKERHHKFGYRLKRFRDDPTLIWEEGLTERQLAILNGLDRVWDAGKTRYVRHI